MIQNRIKELYHIFKGLPATNPIVRQNQENDAFEILAYDLLFRKNKYNEQLTIEDLSELEKHIIPPPDEAIDIFYQEEMGDEYIFHIVQVKNSELQEKEIKECFAMMKRTMDTYVKKRKDVHNNVKKIISESDFDEEYLADCTYYVVHKGDRDLIKGQKDDEKIITERDLEVIQKSIISFSVPFEKIKADKAGNFLEYDNKDEESKENHRSLLCNLNGYDLAELCIKYINSEVGRNILFGQNLRESLEKQSKTYADMCRTISEEPSNFWYYNNGITIIAEKYDVKTENGEEFVFLENFSIINGAQTTSSFAKYLLEAKRDNEKWKRDKLRNVYVAARVVETKENKILSNKITVRNNTQNPITTRDMVALNDEQARLKKRFLEGNQPNIFIQIRRGEVKPKKTQFLKHQIIANDELAQLVFSSFLGRPFTAKDKKNSLFNRDNSSEEYLINKEYSEIFNYSDIDNEKGIVFKKSKEDINELLFVKFIHNRAKRFNKDFYNQQLEIQEQQLKAEGLDELQIKRILEKIDTIKLLKQINNISLFYNLALYYEFKRQFDTQLGFANKKFDYEKFYGKDKSFEADLIKSFSELFYSETIELIKELGKNNPAQFTRAKVSQDMFFSRLTDKITITSSLQDKYQVFVNKFKI